MTDDGWKDVENPEEGWRDVEAPREQVTRAVAAASPAIKDYAKDLVGGTAAGLVRGAAGIPGLPGDVIDLINASRNWWNGTPGAPHSNPLPNSERILQDIGADKWLYEPRTGLGKAASNVASFLPGAAIGGAGVAGRAANAVRFGLVPGVVSEGAGQAADALLPPDYGPAARVAGGLAGIAAGHKITSPNLNVSPNADIWNDAVGTLQREGVPIDPGAASGKKGLTYLYDELNPERYQPIRGAFTQAAMRRAGVDDLATFGQDGTIPRVHREASQQFENAIANSPGVPLDRQLVQDSVDRLAHVRKPGLFEDADVQKVEGAIQRIRNLMGANNNVIPSREYQTLRSDLNEQARAVTDPRVGRQLNAVVDSLDNAMERAIAARGGDVNSFNRARNAWRRYLTLKDAADDATGYITPARLQRAVGKVYSENEAENNRTPFSTLARAGDLVLGEAKSSGTSERAAAKKWLDTPGRVAGTIGGAFLGNGGSGAESIGGLAGALSGEHLGDLVSPVVRGLLWNPALDNPVTRRYLGNQLAGRADDILSVPGLLSVTQALNKRDPLRITVHPLAPQGGDSQ